MDRHLNVVILGHLQTTIDRRRRRPPVFVQLESDGARADLLDESFGTRAVAFSGEAEVHREGVGRLQHEAYVCAAGRAGRRVRARRRPGPAADERRDAAGERRRDLLRRDEVNVRVDAAGGHDEALGRDGFGGDADHHPFGDPCHHIRIARFADTGNAAVLDADVRFVEPGPVDDERVGDDAVERVFFGYARRLTHAVAQHLAAAEFAFVAIHGVVALDFGDEIRVAEPHPIAGRRTEQLGVVSMIDGMAHGFFTSFTLSRTGARSCCRRERRGGRRS